MILDRIGRPAPAVTGTASLLVLLLGSGCGSEQPEGRSFEFELVEGEPMYHVLPMDSIPSIDEPVFLDAVAADAVMQPDEPVLGVVGADGTAKCYSAWQLDGHEIVNDTLDGAAIAVTW